MRKRCSMLLRLIFVFIFLPALNAMEANDSNVVLKPDFNSIKSSHIISVNSFQEIEEDLLKRIPVEKRKNSIISYDVDGTLLNRKIFFGESPDKYSNQMNRKIELVHNKLRHSCLDVKNPTSEGSFEASYLDLYLIGAELLGYDTPTLADPYIPTFVKNFSQQDFYSMILTARGKEHYETTKEELGELWDKYFAKINHHVPTPFIFPDMQYHAREKAYCVFTGGKDKGPISRNFLARSDQPIEYFVHIDDTFSQLRSIQDSLFFNTNYIGYHFRQDPFFKTENELNSHVNECLKAFSSDIQERVWTRSLKLNLHLKPSTSES